ncbi:hypothetical protein H6E30_002279 [Salmonella enterica]|nr:hypothetical protein [Salmonella enterica]
MAEQHRLLEEVLFAAEVAHREELKIQRLELEQKIQGIHQQFFRGGELSRIIESVELHHGCGEYIAEPLALQYLNRLEYTE